MVTNRARQEIIWNARNEKFPEVAKTTGTVDVFDPLSGISGPASRKATACPNLHEWWTQRIHVRCPIAQLLIKSKSGCFWSIISEMVTVLCWPGRGASHVEKSPRLNWATQFLSVAYDGACSPNVSIRIAWNSFGGTWRDHPFQRDYQFRPTTSGSRTA